MLKRYVFVVLALSLAVLLLAHCGGAPEPETILEHVEVEREAAAPAPTKAPAAFPTWTVSPAPPEPQAANASGSAALTQPRAQRMIIKNAELELLVSHTDVALDGITVIAVDYGGYIISTHTWYEDEYKLATVRLGVPVLEFENVLRRLRGLALQVISEIASGEDVTDQYVDLQSRLTNLQATRDRIREFLEKAETVEEALQVNEQLSLVEGQIEEIQGRMNYLRDRAAYSTIEVQLNPDRPTPTPTPTPTVTPTPTPSPTPTPEAWLPGETLKSATSVLTTVVRTLVDVVIWVLVVLGPFLAVAALIVGLILWWRRRRMRKAPLEPPDPVES
jgi:hypothetical protein